MEPFLLQNAAMYDTTIDGGQASDLVKFEPVSGLLSLLIYGSKENKDIEVYDH